MPLKPDHPNFKAIRAAQAHALAQREIRERELCDFADRLAALPDRRELVAWLRKVAAADRKFIAQRTGFYS